MAFASGEYLEAWSRSTTLELRQKSMMLTILSKEGTDSWVSGAAKVHIPKPTFTNASASNRARGGDWKAATEIAQDTVEFARIGGANVSNEVLAEDALEIPWPLIDKLRSRQSFELAKQLDSTLYSWIIGTNGIPSGGAVTYGSAGTNFIARTSPWRGNNDASNKLVYDAIEAFELLLQRADALDGIGDAVGQKWMVMPPEIFRALRVHMLKVDLHWDLLTASLLSGGSVLGGAQYQGRLLGIDIFTWNGVAIPTGTSNWKFIAGCRAGAYANVRPSINQFFDPSENQVSSKPAYLSRMAMETAAAMGEGSVFQEITIHAD